MATEETEADDGSAQAATPEEPADKEDEKEEEQSSDADSEVVQVRSRMFKALLLDKHRADAAALARAYQDAELSTYLSADLEKLRVDESTSLNDELSRQYAKHVLPTTDLTHPVPRPPPSVHEKPPRRKWRLWLFSPCTPCA